MDSRQILSLRKLYPRFEIRKLLRTINVAFIAFPFMKPERKQNAMKQEKMVNLQCGNCIFHKY